MRRLKRPDLAIVGHFGRPAPTGRSVIFAGRSGLVLGVLALATACQEPPSYAVRWRVRPRPGMQSEPTATPQNPEMNNPVACSRVGISTVDIRVYDDVGSLVDQRTHACFPRAFGSEGAAVTGGTIAPGEYTVVVRGARANRVPWGDCVPGLDDDCVPSCDEQAEARCGEGFDSCDCTSLSVREDTTVRLPDLVLDAPPECEDGIDNDNNGLTDARDPACQRGDSEDGNFTNALLLLRVSAFNDNPNVTCRGLGVDFVIEIDPEDGGAGCGTQCADKRITPCELGDIPLSVQTGVGDHTMVFTAVQGATQLTTPRVFDFNVSASGAINPTLFEIDIRDTDFIDPVVASTAFSIGFATPSGPTRLCEPPHGNLEITQVTMDLVDASGTTVAPPVRLTDGVPLNGEPFACPITVLNTEPLQWGVFAARLQGLNADGVACFTTTGAGIQLAPGGSTQLVLERNDSLEGADLISCQDCQVDEDCGQEWVCDPDNLCQPA